MSVPDNQPPDNHLVIIEMFCGGSHKQLIQHLLSLAPDTTLSPSPIRSGTGGPGVGLYNCCPNFRPSPVLSPLSS